MKLRYFLFFVHCLCAWCFQAQVQLQLPIEYNGTIVVFSYEPNERPVEIATLIKGKAVLSKQYLKDGLYSIYFTDSNSIENAPYIDLWITEKEPTFSMYWIPTLSYAVFEGSPINTLYQDRAKEVNRWFEEYEKFTTSRRVFTNATDELSQKWSFEIEKLNEQKKDMLTRFESEKEPYVRPLLFLLEGNGVYEESDFVHRLRPTDYNTSIVSNYIKYTFNRLNSKDGSKSEELLVKTLIDTFGKTEEGVYYLIKWIDVTYNKNRSQELYVYALTQLMALNKPDKVLKQTWQKKIENGKKLIKGTIFPNELLPVLQQIDNQTKLAVVLYSASCGACDELLEKVNQLDEIAFRVAIRVKPLEETKVVKEENYKNLLFDVANDYSKYEPYVVRGTPVVLFLKKEKNVWIIDSVE